MSGEKRREGGEVGGRQATPSYGNITGGPTHALTRRMCVRCVVIIKCVPEKRTTQQHPINTPHDVMTVHVAVVSKSSMDGPGPKARNSHMRDDDKRVE